VATRCFEMGAPLLPPAAKSKMQTAQKTKLLKLRLTAAEHATLVALASGEASVSAFARKRLFGQASGMALRLASIHASVLQIARAAAQETDNLRVVQILTHLVAIERAITELVSGSLE